MEENSKPHLSALAISLFAVAKAEIVFYFKYPSSKDDGK
jgi:hypothetical protein